MSAIPPQYPGDMAAISEAEAQQDETHMKVLMILYYVISGLSIFGVCFGGLYLAIGIFAFQNPEVVPSSSQGANDPPAEFFGLVFTAVGGFVLLLALLSGILYFLVARGIKHRRGRVLTFIMAGLACLNIPLGTALGVYTFIVMLRPGVKRMYGIEP